ncbi:MAG TPA: DUF998 domain-containing protein [Gaiellaceae bacterium]|nr:DUF998 domain-containing protein [Gaiellaceae bacterium]
MAAAAASLVFTGLCVGCLVYLHLAPTGYSPVTDAVSRYGVGRFARWYQAQAACAGIAGILLAVALRHPRHVVVLLVVFGAARLAITQFPMDTRRGPHALLAVAAFGAVTSAAIRLTSSLHGAPALGWAMLVALVAGIVLRQVAFGAA